MSGTPNQTQDISTTCETLLNFLKNPNVEEAAKHAALFDELVEYFKANPNDLAHEKTLQEVFNKIDAIFYQLSENQNDESLQKITMAFVDTRNFLIFADEECKPLKSVRSLPRCWFFDFTKAITEIHNDNVVSKMVALVRNKMNSGKNFINGDFLLHFYGIFSEKPNNSFAVEVIEYCLKNTETVFENEWLARTYSDDNIIISLCTRFVETLEENHPIKQLLRNNNPRLQLFKNACLSLFENVGKSGVNGVLQFLPPMIEFLSLEDMLSPHGYGNENESLILAIVNRLNQLGSYEAKIAVYKKLLKKFTAEHWSVVGNASAKQKTPSQILWLILDENVSNKLFKVPGKLEKKPLLFMMAALLSDPKNIPEAFVAGFSQMAEKIFSSNVLRESHKLENETKQVSWYVMMLIQKLVNSSESYLKVLRESLIKSLGQHSTVFSDKERGLLRDTATTVIQKLILATDADAPVRARSLISCVPGIDLSKIIQFVFKNFPDPAVANKILNGISTPELLTEMNKFYGKNQEAIENEERQCRSEISSEREAAFLNIMSKYQAVRQAAVKMLQNQEKARTDFMATEESNRELILQKEDEAHGSIIQELADIRGSKDFVELMHRLSPPSPASASQKQNDAKKDDAASSITNNLEKKPASPAAVSTAPSSKASTKNTKKDSAASSAANTLEEKPASPAAVSTAPSSKTVMKNTKKNSAASSAANTLEEKPAANMKITKKQHDVSPKAQPASQPDPKKAGSSSAKKISNNQIISNDQLISNKQKQSGAKSGGKDTQFLSLNDAFPEAFNTSDTEETKKRQDASKVHSQSQPNATKNESSPKNTASTASENNPKVSVEACDDKKNPQDNHEASSSGQAKAASSTAIDEPTPTLPATVATTSENKTDTSSSQAKENQTPSNKAEDSQIRKPNPKSNSKTSEPKDPTTVATASQNNSKVSVEAGNDKESSQDNHKASSSGQAKATSENKTDTSSLQPKASHTPSMKAEDSQNRKPNPKSNTRTSEPTHPTADATVSQNKPKVSVEVGNNKKSSQDNRKASSSDQAKATSENKTDTSFSQPKENQKPLNRNRNAQKRRAYVKSKANANEPTSQDTVSTTARLDINNSKSASAGRDSNKDQSLSQSGVKKNLPPSPAAVATSNNSGVNKSPSQPWFFATSGQFGSISVPPAKSSTQNVSQFSQQQQPNCFSRQAPFSNQNAQHQYQHFHQQMANQSRFQQYHQSQQPPKQNFHQQMANQAQSQQYHQSQNQYFHQQMANQAQSQQYHQSQNQYFHQQMANQAQSQQAQQPQNLRAQHQQQVPNQAQSQQAQQPHNQQTQHQQQLQANSNLALWVSNALATMNTNSQNSSLTHQVHVLRKIAATILGSAGNANSQVDTNQMQHVLNENIVASFDVLMKTSQSQEKKMQQMFGEVSALSQETQELKKKNQALEQKVDQLLGWQKVPSLFNQSQSAPAQSTTAATVSNQDQDQDQSSTSALTPS